MKVFDEEAFRGRIKKIIAEIKKERKELPAVRKYVYVSFQLTYAIEHLKNASK